MLGARKAKSHSKADQPLGKAKPKQRQTAKFAKAPTAKQLAAKTKEVEQAGTQASKSHKEAAQSKKDIAKVKEERSQKAGRGVNE